MDPDSGAAVLIPLAGEPCRQSRSQVEIWHNDSPDHWQRALRRVNACASAPPPDARFLPSGLAVCSLAPDPERALCIHGLDSQRVFQQRIRVASSAHRCLGVSPYQLTLLLGTPGQPLSMQSFFPPQDRKAGDRP